MRRVASLLATALLVTGTTAIVQATDKPASAPAAAVSPLPAAPVPPPPAISAKSYVLIDALSHQVLAG